MNVKVKAGTSENEDKNSVERIGKKPVKDVRSVARAVRILETMMMRTTTRRNLMMKKAAATSENERNE